MQKNRKILLSILIFIIVLTIIGIAYYLIKISPFSNNEERINLEGKIIIIQDKYTIPAIETSQETYWFYDTPEKYEFYINKTLRIEAILSPAGKNSICIRSCKDINCQCPNRDLLYNIRILS